LLSVSALKKSFMFKTGIKLKCKDRV